MVERRRYCTKNVIDRLEEEEKKGNVVEGRKEGKIMWVKGWRRNAKYG